MKSAVTDCDLRLYADDTCLLFTNENVSSIEKHVNTDFNSFCEWLIDNKLSIYLGEDKTKCILFKKGKKIRIPKNLDFGFIVWTLGLRTLESRHLGFGRLDSGRLVPHAQKSQKPQKAQKTPNANKRFLSP